jgi:hypothetical protein
MIRRPDFAILFIAQCAFYLSASIGYWRKKQGKPARLLSAPLHFCLMNLAMLLGFLRYLSGQQKLTWNSTPRTTRPETAG